MTIIEALKTYIAAYSGLAENAPVLVDMLGQEPTQYSINPLPGARIAETYINGGTVREYPFSIESMEYTADELQRIQNNGFYEALAEWFDTQSNAGTLPNLGTGKTAEKIEALGWGYLFQPGESNTGIYQVQCKLTYEQEA